MRTAQIRRDTAETKIDLTLTLEGAGAAQIDTGCGFLDHMLTLFARHGGFDLACRCAGDTQVDYHHTVEDVGIALGAAFRQALGEMRGITRYGNFLLPMDESLVLVAVDFSGRAGCWCSLALPTSRVGDFDTELGEEFFQGFARAAAATIHLKKLAGRNSHHILEAAFKGFGRALRQAVSLDERAAGQIPSTKGVL